MQDERKPDPGIYQATDGEHYRPHVPAAKNIAEFSLKAVVTGIVLGIVFGMANAYLGLAAGVTVSASIPVAVMSVGVFSAMHKFGLSKRATVLESNLSQTVGSAGESLAAGVIFTMPALFIWGHNPDAATIFVFAALGGILGVLCMIPLRRFLVKEEHGKLPYPEGTACAEVIVGSDSGGVKAARVFIGLGIGALYTFLMSIVGLWKEKVAVTVGALKNSKLAIGLNPAYLGVGFILGKRVAAMMVAGSLLAALVFFPLITEYVDAKFDATGSSTTEKASLVRSHLKHIGVGAVAFAGIITLLRTLPTIVSTIRITAGRALAGRRGGEAFERTDRDIKPVFLVAGILVIAVLIAIVPVIEVKIIGALFIIVVAFVFVAVSARICGIVGSSSNPVSGMTIATLIAATVLVTALGATGTEAKIAAISIGAVVCMALAVAGDTSQDLKTGFLVGATPWKQQVGEVIGVLSSAALIGVTLLILHNTYQIGSDTIPAPQAHAMTAIIDGIVNQDLPWMFLIIGAALAAIFEILGMHSLPLAVGLYIPLGTTAPIFAGGLLRHFVDRKLAKNGISGNKEGGILFGSGMIGGEGLIMVAAALAISLLMGPSGGGLKLLPNFVGGLGEFLGWTGAVDILSLLPFGLLCWLLYRACDIKKR